VAEKDHNAESIIKSAEAKIQENRRRIRRSDFESLKVHCSTGAELRKVRDVMGWKPFLTWARKTFKIGKQWACRLMWLHEEWDRVLEHLEWAGEREDTKGTRGKHTPDGVWLLFQEKAAAELREGKGAEETQPVQLSETQKKKKRRVTKLATAERRIGLLESILIAHNLPIPVEEADEQEVNGSKAQGNVPSEPDPQPPGEPVHPVDEPENPIPDSKPPSEPKDGTPDDDGEPEGPAEPPQPGPQV
jgi:hypothetical protein